MSGQAGAIVSALLLIAMLLTKTYISIGFEIAELKHRGAAAEEAVGAVLDCLIEDGYRILHDLEHVLPGNVDHVVSGPTGVFLVETKSNGFARRDLGRTKNAARLLAQELDVRWVVPVICLHRRPDVHWTQERVAVVGISRLAAFIRANHGAGADLDRLTAVAARG